MVNNPDIQFYLCKFQQHKPRNHCLQILYCIDLWLGITIVWKVKYVMAEILSAYSEINYGNLNVQFEHLDIN